MRADHLVVHTLGKCRDIADSLSGDIYLVRHGDRASFITERMEVAIADLRRLLASTTKELEGVRNSTDDLMEALEFRLCQEARALGYCVERSSNGYSLKSANGNLIVLGAHGLSLELLEALINDIAGGRPVTFIPSSCVRPGKPLRLLSAAAPADGVPSC